MFIRRIFCISLLVVCVAIEAYALNFAEDGEDAKFEQALREQETEKATIAMQIEEQKKKAVEENAILVEQIKKEMVNKEPVKEKSPTILNIVSLIILALIAAAIIILR